MFLSVARAHHRRLKTRGSSQSRKEKHNVTAVPVAVFQHVHNIAIVFNVLLLLLLLRSLALIRQIADLLCPGIKLAYLLVPVGFASDGLLRRSLDLLVVAYEALYFLIPVMSGVLPEFVRTPHLPPSVVETDLGFVVFCRRHVFLSFKGLHVLRFHLKSVPFPLWLQVSRHIGVNHGKLGTLSAVLGFQESRVSLYAEAFL